MSIFSQGGHHEESVVAVSTQVAVSLQPLEDRSVSTADDDAQYASVHEGLGPKTIDWAPVALFSSSSLQLFLLFVLLVDKEQMLEYGFFVRYLICRQEVEM